MPSLATLSYVDSHTDGRGGFGSPSPVHRVNAPDNAETAAAASTTAIDMHTTITLPLGYIAFVASYERYDVAGTDNSVTTCVEQVYKGTGSGEAFLFSLVNHHASSTNVAGAGGIIGYLTILPTIDLKHAATGF